MNHVYLTELLIQEALKAQAITEQEAKELIAQIQTEPKELLAAS